MSSKKDCIECVNCDYVRGFMCTCHYSYDTETEHIQVGQDVPRSHANYCEQYTLKPYDRDKIWVL